MSDAPNVTFKPRKIDNRDRSMILSLTVKGHYVHNIFCQRGNYLLQIKRENNIYVKSIENIFKDHVIVTTYLLE